MARWPEQRFHCGFKTHPSAVASCLAILSSNVVAVTFSTFNKVLQLFLQFYMSYSS